MEADAIHELTAAYALDALDEQDEREYEEHLARCPSCREELASLTEAATGLAYGVESPPPPPALRDRILEQARSERPNVVPLRRPAWRSWPIAVAAAAACAAIGLGIWAATLSRSLDRVFRVSVSLKGIDGALEIVGGLALLVFSPTSVHALARTLTQHELSQDPHDFIARHVLQAAGSLTHGTTVYAGVYLLSHGVAKVALVIAVLRNQLWAYPGRPASGARFH